MAVISQSTRKARKEHECSWCSGTIKVGELYDYAFCKYDDVYTWRNHKRCMKIASELGMFDNFGDEGLSQDDFIEHINDHYNNIVLEEDDTKRSFLERLDYVCKINLKELI